MAFSQSTAFRSDHHPHLHVAGEQCPFCGQDIPEGKLEEISGRIAAREQERFAEALAGLQEQYSLEKSQAEAKAKSDLEQAKQEAAHEAEQLKAEAASRETAARDQARKEAEESAAARIAAERAARKEKEGELTAEIAQMTEAKKSAEEASAALTLQLEELCTEKDAALARAASEAAEREKSIHAEATQAAEAALKDRLIAAEEASATLTLQLDELRTEKDAALARAASEAAEREKSIRAEATQAAEATLKDQLTAAEEARRAVEEAKAETEDTLRGQLAVATEQIQTLKEHHAGEINSQREALEKDKEASVNTERARNLEEKMRLERQLSDMQRQLQKKTADEHGEGAELELHELLKGAFEEDRIRRVQRGTAGADIIHEVVHNGKLCGKIVYDSKNRSVWRSEYATKLRADQMAEHADHAVLSTNTFPSGLRQLHIHEHVIIACPARVLALAELLRNHIIQTHELRISNEAREEKSAALYTFITSERCGQLLDSIDALIRKLEQIDVDEQKAHASVWKKRGELLRTALKVNGDFCFEISRIVGTAATAE
jgi:hypothetical protein